MSPHEYLTARYDEEETAARAADIVEGDPTWTVHGPVALSSPRAFRVRSSRDMVPVALVQDVDDESGPTAILDAEAAATHIALHDPARVLADVAAKRAILEHHRPATAEDTHEIGAHPINDGRCSSCVALHDERGYCEQLEYPCPTILAMLQPYADRDDFDPDWKISSPQGAHPHL
ncbi:DUF6221 family protein [Promicromonospora iranensis]|uniref:Nucleic acid/nucleotide deaminase of polymorphic system toxin n=1 Tax=Promicromonospora iranensis TaxID=1105144 RepID=A0ABU2CV56_9MICO|nr:DUF6221 family protein [Promicromonospora iranensis]MDR7385224.1 hypothetical protein [Promicromonospora iranensis]